MDMDTLPSSRDAFKQSSPRNTIQTPFLKFINLLQETVQFHCKVTKEILKEKKGYDFMHEYHKWWSAFVSFAIKMDEVLWPLAETMNKIYDILYPLFPL